MGNAGIQISFSMQIIIEVVYSKKIIQAIIGIVITYKQYFFCVMCYSCVPVFGSRVTLHSLMTWESAINEERTMF